MLQGSFHLMVGEWGFVCCQVSFIQDQIGKVFNGILVYIFHEGFDVIFGDV